MDETLPWQHIHTGVDLQFLMDEMDKAKGEIYTPDCRYEACQKCGVCDFKTLSPIVYNRTKTSLEAAQAVSPAPPPEPTRHTGETGHFKYLVHYSRIGDICFLGHLEILQTIFRALRRAAIETNFSQGFNPSPKISFGPALPVGTESLAEFFIMDLPTPLKNPAAAAELLNTKLAPGLLVNKIELHSGNVPQSICTTYNLTLPADITDSEKKGAEAFVKSADFIMRKIRKGKTKEIDIRPLILDFSVVSAETVQMQMVSTSTQAGIKPLEALTEILGLDTERSMQTRILKTSWHTLDATD
jgi:radical SAM-linked protein